MKNLSIDNIKTIITIISTIASVFFGYFTIKTQIKSQKLPQVIQISKLLIENTFSWGINNIEPYLYKKFNYEIQEKLREFKNKNEEYLVYFDRNFVRILLELCNLELEQNTRISSTINKDFKNFSFYYLLALRTSQKNLGLKPYSYDFRMRNNLYQNIKTGKALLIIDKILSLSTISLAILFVVSLISFISLSYFIFSLLLIFLYCYLIFRGLLR